LDCKRRKLQCDGESYIMRSLITCSLHLMLLGRQNMANGMCGTCSTQREIGNAYRILVGKFEYKKFLERLRRRWEGSIKMDLK